MKRIMPLSLIMLTLLVGQLFIDNSAAAAPVRNLPAVVVQPNGDTLQRGINIVNGHKILMR